MGRYKRWPAAPVFKLDFKRVFRPRRVRNWLKILLRYVQVREDGYDTGCASGFVRLNGFDARVGVVRPDHDRNRLVRQIEIVTVTAVAPNETQILLAPNGLSDTAAISFAVGHISVMTNRNARSAAIARSHFDVP
jgi:hypothetical protein